MSKTKNHSLPHSQEASYVFTDGSCASNQGGFGFIRVVDVNNFPKHKKPPNINDIEERENIEKWGWPDGTEGWYGKTPYSPCTNQISELFAIYWALVRIPGDIVFYTDSAYAIGCLSKWWLTWRTNGWKNAKGKTIANKSLIKACLLLMHNREISFCWVKGHGNNIWNIYADHLANLGRITE